MKTNKSIGTHPEARCVGAKQNPGRSRGLPIAFLHREKSGMTVVRIVIPLCYSWSMIFSEDRDPPRIKCGAGFFAIML